MTTNRPRSRDEGFILPMALILCVVLALVVAALASYTIASLRAGSVAEQRVDRLAASDGAARIGLERLRTREASCGRGTRVIYSGNLNRQDVEVTCRRTAISTADIGQFAVVITAEGVPRGTASLAAQGTNVASRPRSIGGNVYLAVPPNSLDKPVQVTDGDVYYYSPDEACVDPTYSNLTFKPADERGYVCTPQTWQSMFPPPTLPAKTETARSATGKTNAKGCTVFQPGVYKKPPLIGTGTQNFFEPGTYYFEFDEAFQIKNALVIGGTSGPTGAGSSTVARTATTFPSSWCANAIDNVNRSGIADTGVTWIFGGNSRISVDPNGQLELFAPTRPATTLVMPPSIIALQSSMGGFLASTLGPTVAPLVDLQEGSSNGVVIHGAVWAPTSAINLGNIAQSANGQFLGGLVVSLLNLQTAASAGNFNLRVVTTAATRRVVLTSKSGNTVTRVVALLRPSTGSYAIESRRVE
jgi:hypothetical protein